jgi:LAO/AO transport system kinase
MIATMTPPRDNRHDLEHQRDLRPGASALSVDKARTGAQPKPRSGPRRRQLSVNDYVQGVREGDRAILGRAITLIESSNPAHRQTAREVLTAVMPETGAAARIGITGVPGVGKSTFIETLGTNLTQAGQRVAVLAVDPSSSVSGGSILGDKTRMARLSVDPNAFIRPSPAAGTLGGVASKTRETMLLCEAAGFDVVLVETVGVGQSETVVADMTDFFLALMLAGAGDELQGIKRGLLELVDLIAINKADGDNLGPAKRAAQDYRTALRYMQHRTDDWQVPVLTCSAVKNQGVDEVWRTVWGRVSTLRDTGDLAARRRAQHLRWMWAMIDDQLKQALRHHPDVKAMLEDTESAVKAGDVPATLAAQRVLQAFLGDESAGR